MLRDDLFGGLALAWDNEPLPVIPRRAACSLLAYTLTFYDRPQVRDPLTDAVTRRRLSQALWHVGRLEDARPQPADTCVLNWWRKAGDRLRRP